MVRALTFHQCYLGSNPGVDAICGLSLLLVLSLAPRGFSPGTPVFSSPQKPALPNSNSTWSRVDEESPCGCATSKSFFLRAYYILFGLASTTFTYRLINVLWLFNWPCNFSFLIVTVLKQDSPSSLNLLTTEHQPYLTQYFTSGEPLHSKQTLSTAFFLITIRLGGFEEHLPIHYTY